MTQRDRLMRARRLERVIVTLLDGTAFDGMLHSVDDRSLTLLQAFQVSPDGQSKTKADGSVLIPRDRVQFLQKP